MLADESLIAVHFMVTDIHEGEFLGLPSTGNELSVRAIYLARLENGKIVEDWEVSNSLALT